MRVLVAGVGNALRADDAFGVEVAHRMEAMDLPAGVKVVETGIGGMALVQELQNRYDALVLVDCVDYGRPPGQVMVIEPEVIDVHALTDGERSDLLSDMHLAKPERVLMLAKALGCLPGHFIMVGCQPVDPEAYGTGMSPEVTAAVDVAIAEIQRYIDGLLAGDGGADGLLAGDGGADGLLAGDGEAGTAPTEVAG